MILRAAMVPSHAHLTASRLEEIRLGEVIQGLARMLSLPGADLVVDLIVEVLVEGLVRAVFVGVARSRYKLLKLDTSDEVLVLGCHDTVVLGQEEDLMVPLGPFGLLLKICDLFFLRELGKLRRVGDNMGLERE